MIKGHVVADHRRLADHDTHAMVDEQPLADPGAGVDLDPGNEAGKLGNHAREGRKAGQIDRPGEAMELDRLEARIG